MRRQRSKNACTGKLRMRGQRGARAIANSLDREEPGGICDSRCWREGKPAPDGATSFKGSLKAGGCALWGKRLDGRFGTPVPSVVTGSWSGRGGTCDRRSGGRRFGLRRSRSAVKRSQ
jgi:hypothetical protein